MLSVAVFFHPSKFKLGFKTNTPTVLTEQKPAIVQLEEEMKNRNHSWGTIQRLASDRQGWSSFVAALFANWRDGM